MNIKQFIRFVNPKLDNYTVGFLDGVIQTTATNLNLDPKLVVAVIAVESRFNKHAVGKHGEIGLMQLRPKYFGLKKYLENPIYNIERGASYIRRMKEHFEPVYGDLRFIEHYNRGPNKKSTKFLYTKKVKQYFKLLEA